MPTPFVLDDSEDTRNMNMWYLFAHFFSDYRLRARLFDKSIKCFYTYKMLYI